MNQNKNKNSEIMKTNKRAERRAAKEAKKEKGFNQKAKKGMTPYKGRNQKHKGDIFSHMDDELQY